MPLTKSSSKQAFQKNIRAEVKAGRPVKQAVAISYAVKRAAQNKAGGVKTGPQPKGNYERKVDTYLKKKYGK